MQPPLLAAAVLPGLRPGELLQPFFVRPAQRPVVSSDLAPQMHALFAELAAAAQTHAPPAMLQVLLMRIMLVLRQGWEAGGHADGRVDVQARLQPAVRMAFDARRFVPETKAASACSMSRATFKRSFQSVLGISFSRFALRQRLAGAARQLRGTALPAKRVAYEWGFTDSAHLCRCFVQHYGVTPTSYRAIVE